MHAGESGELRAIVSQLFSQKHEARGFAQNSGYLQMEKPSGMHTKQQLRLQMTLPPLRYCCLINSQH